MTMPLACPHCSLVISYDPVYECLREKYADPRTFEPDVDGLSFVEYQLAPCCNRYIVFLSDGQGRRELAWPKAPVLKPVHELVPECYARDYQEAVAVLHISPKASAALSRRCLQHFLEMESGANERWPLEKQIEHANAKTPSMFPPRLAARLDHIRIIGNFAAHPKKNTNTGEIIDVEPDEADYVLEVLVEVLDSHFIEPVKDAERKFRISQKVAETKKAPKP